MKFSNIHYLPLLGLLFLFSCIPPQEITYFQTPEGEEWQKIQAISNAAEITIQPGDQLIIIVSSFDPVAVAPFNRGSGNHYNQQNVYNNTYQDSRSGSHLVSKEGFIDFPVLGTIKAAGLALTELKADLLIKIKDYVNDPVISVQFAEFRVTVLGEVGRKGVVSTTREKLSLLEAIGEAGDITDFGNRSNILLIREQDGQRQLERLDLLTTDIFNSPFYYLKQNDIIYVEPNKRKSTNLSSDQTARVVSLITSVTSLTALMVALLKN